MLGSLSFRGFRSETIYREIDLVCQIEVNLMMLWGQLTSTGLDKADGK